MNIFGLYVDITSLNIGISISGAVISATLFIASLFEHVKGNRESFYMQSLTLSSVLMFLFNALTYLEASDFAIGIADRIFISAAEVFTIATIYNSNMYIVCRLRNKTRIPKVINYILPSVNIVAAAAFCVGMLPDMDWYYIVNDRYEVLPTAFYMIINAVELICSALNIVIIISGSKNLEKEEMKTWLSVYILPVISLALFQIWRIDLTGPAFGIALVIFYVAIHNRDIIEKHVMEKELVESNAKLLVSQIQPHFMYNALNTIYYLIGQDQNTAREAVSTFSDYLRGNVKSLKNNSPVPIEEELNHVKAYLSLEKLRFEDKIRVHIDERASSFMIPPLTIQPLVENAIKHGLSVKKEGGSLLIRTYEDDKYYYVEVSDDGEGFVAGKFDDREGTSTHVGLFNVYSRLKNMSGGKLKVSSQPGEGTQCLITIPKTGKDDWEEKPLTPIL